MCVHYIACDTWRKKNKNKNTKHPPSEGQNNTSLPFEETLSSGCLHAPFDISFSSVPALWKFWHMLSLRGPANTSTPSPLSQTLHLSPDLSFNAFHSLILSTCQLSDFVLSFHLRCVAHLSLVFSLHLSLLLISFRCVLPFSCLI